MAIRIPTPDSTAPTLCDWCYEPATVRIADSTALDGYDLACPVHSVAVHVPGWWPVMPGSRFARTAS